jgi:hypothetical protein
MPEDPVIRRLLAAALDVVTSVSADAMRRQQTYSALVPYRLLGELEAACDAVSPEIVAATRRAI